MKLRSRIFVGLFLGVVCSPVAFAEDIPLKYWTVPQYSLGGIGKAVDATPPRAFIGLPPCRVIDTRGGAPIAGGIFANSEARNYLISGICGLPFGVDAVSVNFTVTGSPAAPPGAFLLAWPQGQPAPPVSILNFQAGQTIANAAIVPMGSPFGEFTVNVSHSTHVIMDINGYFSDTYAGQAPFALVGSSTSPLIQLQNDQQFCPDACGLSVFVRDGVAIVGSHNSVESNGVGVLGSVSAQAPYGVGVSGYAPGANGTGVLGQAGGANGFGVFFIGGLAGTGTKSFIEPHPTDPSLAIKYVSLEGPEAGTYFRGKGKFQRGIATIAVPETFRMVTAEEGLSVQVTPIGGMASVGVLRIDLAEIVVQGSRDLEFFYTVNGVRRAYPNWNPITSSTMAFRPRSAEEPIPDNLSEDERARLIANGTYTKDGKVNLETARKLGWDKEWKSGRK